MDLKTCRLCGENKGTVYVFSHNKELQLSAKIMHCCPKLNVAENDGLPVNICEKCEEKLEILYQFVLKCEATDQRLRSFAIGLNENIFVNKTKDEEKCFEIHVKSEENPSSHDEDNIGDFIEEFKEEVPILSQGSKSKVKSKRTYKKRKHKYGEDKLYKCSVCGLKCASSSSLTLHMRNHTGERPFSCPSCDNKYKDQGGLKRHIDRNHTVGERQRNYVCEHCGKGFYTRYNVQVHMRTHTGETPYRCLECPLKFTQISSLIRHKRRHAGYKPHICATCGKQFCTKQELKAHMDVHTDERKFSCSFCNIPFKCKNNLRKHMEMHTNPNSFVCNHCGRSFHHKGNLKDHIRRLHSENSGYCDICSKSFPNIELHTMTHTGQKPLKCEQCSSTFITMKTLARHVNYKHNQTKKFKCETCGMHFPAKAMLEFHFAKEHGTSIPFPCDSCSRGFYRKNDLARHKIGTHKERLVP